MLELVKKDSRVTAWVPAALWGGVILFFSLLPYGANIPLTVGGFDKMAHFFEYAVLSPLLLRAMHRSGWGPAPKIMLFTLISVTVYGILMELFQSFIPGRDASVSDALSNLAGAIFGIILWKTILWRK